MENKKDNWHAKPKGDKHLLAEQLALQEARSNAKVYPALPVDNSNNPIAAKNVWNPTHGSGTTKPLDKRKIKEVTHDLKGNIRADKSSLTKGSGPTHAVEGRSFQAHNYKSQHPKNPSKNVVVVEKIKSSKQNVPSNPSKVAGTSSQHSKTTSAKQIAPIKSTSGSINKSAGKSQKSAPSNKKAQSR